MSLHNLVDPSLPPPSFKAPFHPSSSSDFHHQFHEEDVDIDDEEEDELEDDDLDEEINNSSFRIPTNNSSISSPHKQQTTSSNFLSINHIISPNTPHSPPKKQRDPLLPQQQGLLPSTPLSAANNSSSNNITPARTATPNPESRDHAGIQIVAPGILFSLYFTGLILLFTEIFIYWFKFY